MPINLITDVSSVSPAVRAELVRGHHARSALAEARQRAVEQEHGYIESRLIDGVGQLAFRVDSEVYWNMRRRFGDDCWKDPGFRRDFLKKNPGARVRAVKHSGRIIRP